MGFEVAMIGGDAVGAIEYGEEIWQQVDQHSTGKPPAREAARSPSATGAPDYGRVGRGMIAATSGRNKRDIWCEANGSAVSSQAAVRSSHAAAASSGTATRSPSRNDRAIGTKISFAIGEEER